MKNFITLLLSFLMIAGTSSAKEIPVVIIGYAQASEAGLCLYAKCEDPNKTELAALQGYWHETPMHIIPRPIKSAKKMDLLKPSDALVYDYSMQFYGNKQDVVSSFIKEDHKKLWELLERAYLKNQRAVRRQSDVRVLGYAVHPKHPDYLFTFTTYKNAEKETVKRIYIFTLEGDELKRTFSFAAKEKEIYRVINTAFKNAGEDFKVYKYGKNGTTLGRLNNVFPQNKN